jgi:hypothetical protein
MNNKTEFLKNKKGVTSINFIILMITALLFIMGGIMFISKTMAINEIQGIMDKSGVIALRYAVDDTKWRMEEDEFLEESVARTHFENLIKESIKTSERSLIQDFEIEEINVYGPNDTGIKRLGIPGGGERNQYYLESTIRARFRSDPIIDRVVYASISFFDFLRTKRDTSKIASGAVNDGYVEIVVRSVSRIVMR